MQAGARTAQPRCPARLGNHIGNELGAYLEHLENAGIRAYGARTERGYAFMWVGDRAIAASVQVLSGAGFEFTAFTESDRSNEDTT